METFFSFGEIVFQQLKLNGLLFNTAFHPLNSREFVNIKSTLEDLIGITCIRMYHVLVKT